MPWIRHPPYPYITAVCDMCMRLECRCGTGILDKRRCATAGRHLVIRSCVGEVSQLGNCFITACKHIMPTARRSCLRAYTALLWLWWLPLSKRIEDHPWGRRRRNFEALLPRLLVCINGMSRLNSHSSATHRASLG